MSLVVRQAGGFGSYAGFGQYGEGSPFRVANDAFWAVAGREPTPSELARWAAHPAAIALHGPNLRAAMQAAGVSQTTGPGSTSARRVATDAFWAVVGRAPTAAELVKWANHPAAVQLDGLMLRAAMEEDPAVVQAVAKQAAAAKAAAAKADADAAKRAADAAKQNADKAKRDADKLPAWALPVGIGAAVIVVGGILFAAFGGRKASS